MPCRSPIYVEPRRFARKVPVPCGKCVACKKRRVNSWVHRLQEEDRVSKYSHFITLTYDTHHVPISSNGFMTLNPDDLQKFWKRLRKYYSDKKRDVQIRYYAVGEYGEKNSRPHYHAIVFGVPDVESYVRAWSHSAPVSEYAPQGRRAFGTLDVGQVSGNSIAYVCKYLDKRKRIPAHKNDDRVKEFSRMSQGLGKSYLDRMKEWHRIQPEKLYIVKRGGERIAMPKYYRDRIWDDDEKVLQLYLVADGIEEREEQFIKDCIKNGKDPDQYREEIIAEEWRRFQRKNSKNRLL